MVHGDAASLEVLSHSCLPTNASSFLASHACPDLCLSVRVQLLLSSSHAHGYGAWVGEHDVGSRRRCRLFLYQTAFIPLPPGCLWLSSSTMLILRPYLCLRRSRWTTQVPEQDTIQLASVFLHLKIQLEPYIDSQWPDHRDLHTKGI